MSDSNPWLTVDGVMSLRPCPAYPREHIEGLFKGRKRVRLTTALRSSLPVEDRIWLGCQLLPEIRWWCADRAVRVHAPAALEKAGLGDHAAVLRALAPVGTRAAQAASRAARDAARDAAEAARAAAWAAARAAADAAADAAPGAAAGDAAWDAAWAAQAAARDAAWDAEPQLQLDRLIEMARGAV